MPFCLRNSLVFYCRCLPYTFVWVLSLMLTEHWQIILCCSHILNIVIIFVSSKRRKSMHWLWHILFSILIRMFFTVNWIGDYQLINIAVFVHMLKNIVVMVVSCELEFKHWNLFWWSCRTAAQVIKSSLSLHPPLFKLNRNNYGSSMETHIPPFKNTFVLAK